MARNIESFKLRTELTVDNTKFSAGMKASEKDVDNLGKRFTRLGPEVDKALKGKELGTKFGQSFGSSATSLITGSFDTLGQTLGSIIGTAIAPGIGTAIGSTLGSGFDKIAGTVLGTIGPLIQRGMDLNKVLESTTIEFTTFVGSEKEAKKYLAELVQLSGDIGILPTTLIETSEKLYDLTGNLKLTRSLLKAAADQAQDFGGSVETFQKIADVLGLIAEKGNLSKREIQQLYKVGINVPKILAEAFGKTPKQIEQLMAAGRIRGEIAAGLVAASIEREKAGYAALQARTSLSGVERRNDSLTMTRAAEGTRNASSLIRDFYSTANDVLSSPQAQQFVKFIDEKTGSLINMVEKASRAGVNVAEGLGAGIMSGDALQSLRTSFTSLGDFTETSLKSVFKIESPSQRMIDKVGIPIGLGVGAGTSQGMIEYAKANADHDVEAFIRLYEQAAIDAQKRTGVPASVSMAQAILESGAGRSGLTKKAKNFFGIKGRGPAGSVSMRTREETRGGASYYVNAPFRAYNTAGESFEDHAQFLLGNRYRGALAYRGDPKAYAQHIASAGYATDRNYAGKVGGLIDKYGLGRLDMAANGAAITDMNPMPVRFVADSMGGASALFGQKKGPAYSTSVDFDPASLRPLKNPEIPKATLKIYEDMAPAAVQLTNKLVPLDDAMKQWASTTAVTALGLPPLTEAERKVGDSSISVKQTLKELEAQFGFTGIAAEDLIGKLSGAIGQAAGMLPQQQVGKKRGLFSKILGFAAPFLSFIPGVGPILSQVAGMASAGLAGNWSGVASGLAGGLSPGGVFRSSGGGGASGGAGTIIASGTGSPGHSTIGHRAMGGPVRRGQSYVVGEQRPELFIPNSDGWIHPRIGAQGGGGMHPEMVSVMQEIRDALRENSAGLASLRSFPMDHVVMKGARGYIKAMDQDAGLVRAHGQRLRLP